MSLWPIAWAGRASLDTRISVTSIVPKVREDASAIYFKPDRCEVVINFVPFEAPRGEDAGGESPESYSDEPSGGFDFDEATSQLVDQIEKAEEMRPFVGLKWFRDQFLPQSGYDWARDPRTSGSLLRHSTSQRLILTSQEPNPESGGRSSASTAIRVITLSSAGRRFQSEPPGRTTGLTPIPIRGGLDLRHRAKRQALKPAPGVRRPAARRLFDRPPRRAVAPDVRLRRRSSLRGRGIRRTPGDQSPRCRTRSMSRGFRSVSQDRPGEGSDAESPSGGAPDGDRVGVGPTYDFGTAPGGDG